MINLEWFRTFKSIYEKGSMTAAAETLFISQPGVSLHLSSLEDHVGYKLFERMPRKLVPTERGKLLYNAIVDPINRLQEMEKNFQKSTREDTPSLTIGMCFETYQETLERHVPSLDFDLILEFGEYRELLKKIEDGIIDLVVTPHKREAKGVLFTPFSQENIILAAGNGMDTTGFTKALESDDKEAVLEWLTSQKWYGITGDNEHLLRFWQQNFNASPDFRPNYIVPNIHSIINSLSAGPGLGVIPDFLCLNEIQRGAIKLLWSGFSPLRNTLYLARRKDAMYPEQLQRIVKLLKRDMPSYVD